MNRLLAEGVKFLNAALAGIFVLVGTIAGGQRSEGYAIIGGVIGFAVAVMVCGLLALFIEIRSELIRIREALEKAEPRNR